MARRGVRWLVWAVVLVAVVVLAGVLVTVRDREAGHPTGVPPAPTSTVPPAPAEPVLAVKVDNVMEARPQSGLGAADVIYVEPVEGGLTRLVAVYAGDLPDEVGPVRSARRTDLDLVAQWGKPVLAYSGAAPELLPALHAADIVNASPAETGAAYHRAQERRAPHNLFVRPARLPDGAVGPVEAPLLYGPVPAGGVPTARQDVRFPAARFTFAWSPADGRWLVAMNGVPVTSTESGRLTASTVVVQHVAVTTSEPIEDAHGTLSPVARTVGAGRAEVLRNGLSFAGTWDRPTPADPTRYHATAGRELPLAPGPVWVLLLPA